MVVRIAHIATMHTRYDIRIFLKECLSLVAVDYEVHLIVADGLGFAKTRGVHIHDVGSCKGKLSRMLLLPFKMLRKANEVNARIYHLHEPELLLVALFLMMSEKKVIYDSHEDMPRAILSRDWIKPFLRGFISWVFEFFENFVVKKITAVIGATPTITARFAKINKKLITINNFPLPCEFIAGDEKRDNRFVCYQGGISAERGIFEILGALQHTQASLFLVGPIAIDAEKIKGMEEWSRVEYSGIVSRVEVNNMMRRSCVGLLVFHPEPNHVNAQPNKMFEYMSAGLPIIASNFPLWKEIIEGNKCGICVDPFDIKGIAAIINYLLANPDIAQQMGENGKEAVSEKYNWGIEEKKLVKFYKELCG